MVRRPVYAQPPIYSPKAASTMELAVLGLATILSKLGVGLAALLFVLAAVNPSIVSAVIAGGFMLLNSFLIWYLTHRQSVLDRREEERLARWEAMDERQRVGD